MASLTLRGINKRYEETEVMKSVNLDINDGEFVVFVGPSGCGKSTLMRMIAGLEDISAGDLMIDGTRVNELPPAKRGIAMVFQSYALYPHMTLYDNMAFGLKLAGEKKPEIDAAVSRRRRFSTSITCWTASRSSFRAGSGSGWRSGARSCASRTCSSSTNRFRTSTPRCACRCASNSRGCTTSSRRR